MGQTSIEWTSTHLPDGTVLPGYTLNFWWGCCKVSAGCQHCYAETFSKRVGKNIWGPPQTTERWRTKGPWLDCLKWDRQAKAKGVRRNVFCQSMSDFFEDHPQVEPWRKEAMAILEGFEWLNVQLLTKRIENVLRMIPDHWLANWPPHIWIGTSVEKQEQADRRIPELLKVPAAIHFLSCEPLLGPVNLKEYLGLGEITIKGWTNVEQHLSWVPAGEPEMQWVIVGGESGTKARPMHPEWVRGLLRQCQAAGVPFFFKQHGEFINNPQIADLTGEGWRVRPEWLPVIQGKEWGYLDINGKYQKATTTWNGRQNDPRDDYEVIVYKVGKHAAGRLLDGQEWASSL